MSMSVNQVLCIFFEVHVINTYTNIYSQYIIARLDYHRTMAPIWQNVKLRQMINTTNMAVLCNICEVLIDLFYKISAFLTVCRSLSSLSSIKNNFVKPKYIIIMAI